MPRISVANGGQPNRPKAVTLQQKADKEVQREWRTLVKGLPVRGRFKDGFVVPSFDVMRAEIVAFKAEVGPEEVEPEVTPEVEADPADVQDELDTEDTE